MKIIWFIVILYYFWEFTNADAWALIVIGFYYWMTTGGYDESSDERERY